jgi:hypothetical protein
MRDPFGLDAFNLDSLLDGLQFGLDVIGLVPGFGEVADGINGLISLGRGDYVGAGLSFGAMVPVAGWGATAGKFGRRAANAAGAMGGAGKAGGRAGDAGRGAGRGGGRNGAGDNGAGRNGPGLEPSECFPAGTPITMADGSTRPIEAVREGDLVLSADEKTGKQSVQRVTRTFVREAEELYVVCTQDGASIEATGEHPFWVEDKGFVEARRLARSDLLRRVDGRTVSVERVTIRRGEFTVYNLEVAKTHTYYAGNVWVHNQCRGFRNEALRDSHFNDHGADFAAQTPEFYEAQGRHFFNDNDPNTLVRHRPNRDEVRYNPVTDEFGVMAPDNYLRTYYRPDPAIHGYPTNLDYFHAQ